MTYRKKRGGSISQVVSGLVVEKLRVVARRIDVTVTLQLLIMYPGSKKSRHFLSRSSKNSQAPKSKDKHQGSLLAEGQFTCPNGLHRQQQDQDIGGNRVAGIGVPVLSQTNTCRMGRLVPSSANWVALEDGHQRAGNGICRDDAQQDEAADAEPPLDKDSQIQEDNGRFGQADGELVEDLRNVKPLIQQQDYVSCFPLTPKPKSQLRAIHTLRAASLSGTDNEARCLPNP